MERSGASMAFGQIEDDLSCWSQEPCGLLDKMFVKNLQFTFEKEGDNSINYLDLSICRESTKFEYKTYRKPSTTSTTMHFYIMSSNMTQNSCFQLPLLHSKTYSLPDKKNEERTTIHQIAIENNYHNINTTEQVQQQTHNIK
jgi:hypothetical protein